MSAPCVSDTSGQSRKDRKGRADKALTKNKRSRLLSDVSGNQAQPLAKFQQTETTDNCENVGRCGLSESSDPSRGNSELDTAISMLADRPVTLDPDILPRPKRRKKKAAEDRGLPPDQQIRELVKSYLAAQRKYWPKLAKAGHLPEPTQEVIEEMVLDYKFRHRGGKVGPADIAVLAVKLKFGGGYGRFSCDNSQPTSVPDQMDRWLRRAHADGVFIPWAYVYSDYSVSGLDSSRRGYTSYKAVLSDKDHEIKVTYVDDFTRASRDEMEWWKLAALSKRLGKGLIGASDNFDLQSEHGELLMFVYSMLSKLFIKGIRQKVKRGMAGARKRHGVLGKLPLGYTRRIKRDASGNIVYRANGKPAHETAKDPATFHFVELMFKLFVEQNKSPGWIARHFTALQVDGWEGWTRGAILGLLSNPAYLGVFIWNRTRREFDAELQQWVVVENPRSEWTRDSQPHLRLISNDLWKKAQRRLKQIRAASPLTGRKRTRCENYPSTLLSGVLYCGYCEDQPLTLFRSTKKYKNLYCSKGAQKVHRCGLTTSKSVRTIEKSLLGFIRETFLTDSAMEMYVGDANKFLLEEAAKPRTDIAPLVSKEREYRAKIKRLVERVADSDDEELCRGYDNHIRELQRELNLVTATIANIKKQEAPVPPPLDAARLKAYLPKLREILDQETEAASDAISTLTGKINIFQERAPGQTRGAKWIAKFAPDFTRFLAKSCPTLDCPDSVTLDSPNVRTWITPPIPEVAQQRGETSCPESTTSENPNGQSWTTPPVPAGSAGGDCPESATLEYLSRRIWTTPETVTVPLQQTYKYERLAPTFREMHEMEMSVNAMAAAQGMAWQQADEYLKFALYGTKPPNHSRAKRQDSDSAKVKGPRSKIHKYIEHRAAVTHKRDVEKKTFPEIALELNIGVSTTVRAYDTAHPEKAQIARESQGKIDRGDLRQLAPEKAEAIGKRLESGEQNASLIAREVGCSAYLVRKEMKRRGSYQSVAQRMAERPPKPPKKPKVRPGDYVDLVVKLRDVEGLTFERIARRLMISPRAIQKAYDMGRPDILAAAAASGEPPRRSHNARMSHAKIRAIREMIEACRPTGTIIKETGASRTTIVRERRDFLKKTLDAVPSGTSISEIVTRSGCRRSSVELELKRRANGS